MGGAIDQSSPMVFSCTKCNAIISDSTEWLCSYQDINCIVVAGGTNIRIATDGSCDHLGYFQPIFCSKCYAELGKRYNSNVTDYPMATEQFCLTVSAMDSYRLGTGEVRACDRPPARAEEAAPDGASASVSSSLQRRIADLENDLVKVQNMVLLHQERLETLEAAR